MPLNPHEQRKLDRLRASALEQTKPEKRSKMIDEHEDREYENAMEKQGSMKEHEHPYWGKKK